MTQIYARNEPIFATYAPDYFKKGISVIPLEPYNSPAKSAGKKPLPYQWSNWADKPIPESVQQDWLTRYPWANIGIAAGPQSNIIFLDVDSTSPLIKEIFTRLLPSSPWVRVGQKGFVMAYRYSKHIDNFKIHDSNNVTLIECLSKGNQAVIPPSIHPKTHKPYTENRPLLEVIDHLPVLPAELETILRGALEEAGFQLSHSGYSRMTDWVPSGARDNKMTSMAGMFARDVSYGRMTLQEAWDGMSTWGSNLTEQVAGDPVDISKGLWKIVEFLQRDVTGARKKPLPLGWDKDLSPQLKEQCDKIFSKEHEEWTSQELQLYVRDELRKYAGIDSPEKMKIVNLAMERIARSPSMSNLDKEVIYAYINQTSRIPGLSVTNLRKRVREIQQGEITGSNHTEIAEAVLEKLKDDSGEVRTHAGYFWQWKGAQWEKLEEGDVLKKIAEEFGDMESAKRYADHKGIMSVMRVMSSKPLATHTLTGVNFANGYLTVNELNGQYELKMIPHSPELGTTTTLPYRWIPEGATWEKMPRFGQLLRDCWGEDPDFYDKCAALQEMMAATLFGMGTVIQRCALLYGVPNSGKSTIIGVVKGLFPRDSVATCAPDQWQDRFAPATLSEKLLNVCGEMPNNKLIDGKSFKEIIDGTEITGQFKNQPLFQFTPRATHWFGSNHLPKTADTSEGFTRRLLILEFKKPITKEKKVLSLDNRILWEEREAIASWAVAAMPRLLLQKEPTLPDSHEQLITDMAAENNSVRFFFNRCPRVLTLKKVRQLLAQKLKQAEDTVSYQTIATGINGQSVHGLNRGIMVPKMVVESTEAFEKFSQSSENHTSEDILYSEYMLFCQITGGVKPVGVRAWRGRLRELEYEHGFKSILTGGVVGRDESMRYVGIVLGTIQP